MSDVPPEEDEEDLFGQEMATSPLQVTAEGAVPPEEDLFAADQAASAPKADKTPANGDASAQEPVPDTRDSFQRFGDWARESVFGGDTDTLLGFGAGAGQGIIDRYIGVPAGNYMADQDFGALPEGTVRSGGNAIDALPKSDFLSARTLGKQFTGIPAAYAAGASPASQAALGGALGVSNALSEGDDPLTAGLAGAGLGFLGGKLGAAPGKALGRLAKPAQAAVAEVGDWMGHAPQVAAQAGPWLQAAPRRIAQLADDAVDPIMRGAEQYADDAGRALGGMKETALDMFGPSAGRGARAVSPIELPTAVPGAQILSGAAQYGVPAAVKSPIEKLLGYAGKSRAELVGEAAKAAPEYVGRAAQGLARGGGAFGSGALAPGAAAFADPSKAKAQEKAYHGTPTTSWAVESVLSSGTHGLPEDAAQQLTEAVMSGDQAKLISTNFRLSQKYPAYAKRMTDEYQSLQEQEP